MNLAGVLLVIFVVLKCVGVITWPWVLVLIPLWIGFAIVAVFFVVAVITALAATGIAHSSRRLV